MVINCKSQVSPYCQRVGSVAQYFNNIRKYPILNKNEEKELLIQAQGNNKKLQKEAIEILVNCNQRFVASAAMKYANGDDLLDIINEGNIGLITAIERFDVSKDVKFITYAAWWIQKSINYYLTNYRNLVIPANASKLRTVTNKVRHEFFLKEQRYPSLIEMQEILKEKYNFNVENLSDLEPFQSLSIDDNSYEDEETFSENPLYTNVTSSNNIEEENEKNDTKKIISEILKKLNKRDRFIIENAFGIGCTQQTYDSIADELSLTKERIRQKVSEIIKKLGKYIKEDKF